MKETADGETWRTVSSVSPAGGIIAKERRSGGTTSDTALKAATNPAAFSRTCGSSICRRRGSRPRSTFSASRTSESILLASVAAGLPAPPSSAHTGTGRDASIRTREATRASSGKSSGRSRSSVGTGPGKHEPACATFIAAGALIPTEVSGRLAPFKKLSRVCPMRSCTFSPEPMDSIRRVMRTAHRSSMPSARFRTPTCC